MPSSNNIECFRQFIGKRVIGVLVDAFPVNRSDLQPGNKTLVFEDGCGLTISSGGSYWVEGAAEVSRAIEQIRSRLENTQRDIQDILRLAGVHKKVRKTS